MKYISCTIWYTNFFMQYNDHMMKININKKFCVTIKQIWFILFGTKNILLFNSMLRFYVSSLLYMRILKMYTIIMKEHKKLYILFCKKVTSKRVPSLDSKDTTDSNKDKRKNPSNTDRNLYFVCETLS